MATLAGFSYGAVYTDPNPLTRFCSLRGQRGSSTRFRAPPNRLVSLHAYPSCPPPSNKPRLPPADGTLPLRLPEGLRRDPTLKLDIDADSASADRLANRSIPTSAPGLANPRRGRLSPGADPPARTGGATPGGNPAAGGPLARSERRLLGEHQKRQQERPARHRSTALEQQQQRAKADDRRAGRRAAEKQRRREENERNRLRNLERKAPKSGRGGGPARREAALPDCVPQKGVDRSERSDPRIANPNSMKHGQSKWFRHRATGGKRDYGFRATSAIQHFDQRRVRHPLKIYPSKPLGQT